MTAKHWETSKIEQTLHVLATMMVYARLKWWQPGSEDDTWSCVISSRTGLLAMRSDSTKYEYELRTRRNVGRAPRDPWQSINIDCQTGLRDELVAPTILTWSHHEHQPVSSNRLLVLFFDAHDSFSWYGGFPSFTSFTAPTSFHYPYYFRRLNRSSSTTFVVSSASHNSIGRCQKSSYPLGRRRRAWHFDSRSQSSE